MKIKLYFLIVFGFIYNSNSAQILDRIAERAKQKAKDRVDQKIDQGIDKSLDKVEQGAKDATKKKSSKTDKSNQENANNATSESGNNTSKKSGSSNSETIATGNFDFVSGTKVIAADDFSQDALGDFPLKWNTNGTGELVSIAGKEGKWLKMGGNTVILSEFVKTIANNSTIEFDLISSDDYNFYSTYFHIIVTENNDKSQLKKWQRFSTAENGVMLGFHPEGAGGNAGMARYDIIEKSEKVMDNEKSINVYTNKKNKVHIGIWRQNQRMRVYIDKTKIYDIPKAFQTDVNYKGLLFAAYGYNNETDAYYIGNIRVAEAGGDMRHKILDEGKFVTNDILFDVNQSVIKSSSFTVLNEMGEALKSSPKTMIKITGHTDSDGEAVANLKLSEERAMAIKTYLVNKFDLNEDHISVEGKGESVPVADNKTAEGKAKNRRVEFIKL